MLNRSLRYKISKLKRALDLGWITFYLSVQDELNLPPDDWLTFRELQDNLIYGLEIAKNDNYPVFFKTVRCLQKLYIEFFEDEDNAPVSMVDFL